MASAAVPTASPPVTHGRGLRRSGRLSKDITSSKRRVAVPSVRSAVEHHTEVHPELGEVDAEHPGVVGIVRVQAEAASHRWDRGERLQHQVATLNHDLCSGPHQRPSRTGW